MKTIIGICTMLTIDHFPISDRRVKNRWSQVYFISHGKRRPRWQSLSSDRSNLNWLCCANTETINFKSKKNLKTSWKWNFLISFNCNQMWDKQSNWCNFEMEIEEVLMDLSKVKNLLGKQWELSSWKRDASWNFQRRGYLTVIVVDLTMTFSHLFSFSVFLLLLILTLKIHQTSTCCCAICRWNRRH